MSRRREIRGLVAGVVLAIGLVGPPSIAQAAEPPPKSYDNLRELTTTKVPTIADGRIDLDSTVLGQIHCVVSLYGYAWNERDHGATGKPPPRGYGEVVGLGASCEPLQLKLELEPRTLTPFVSAEPPIERESREAVVCTEESKRKLSECPSPSERAPKKVLAAVRRRVASLPWKSELIRGEREAEPAVLQKVGIHEYGESGSGTGQSGRCYPKEKAVVEGEEVERAASFAKVPSGCIALDVIIPQIPLQYVFYGTLEILYLNGFGNGLNASRLEFVQAGELFSSEGLGGAGTITGLLHMFGADQVELMTAR